jgi:hypothetical protein
VGVLEGVEVELRLLQFPVMRPADQVVVVTAAD